LTRELEKKFSDRHVVFIGQRRIMRKPGRNSRKKQPRPMSRTLTSVHEKILEDLVFPSEIVGKRTRVSIDGKKTIKVYVLLTGSIDILGSLIRKILRHWIISLNLSRVCIINSLGRLLNLSFPFNKGRVYKVGVKEYL
jgi:Ribosomal protein S7e